MIYLDSAATTLQKPESVARAAAAAVNSLSSPGRGGHSYARRAAEKAYACRKEAAELFGAAGAENVVFTMNATHALNLAIFSRVRAGDRVVVSGYEHNAVMRPLYSMGAEIAVAEAELYDTEAMLREFKRLTEKKTAAVICNHVSNVFGYILPIEEIAELCKQREIPFILDASQSAGVLDINMTELGADFICMPGHKSLYGPQGSGLLLCRTELQPLIYGGTGSRSEDMDMPDFLPDRGEAGTHNMPGISGLYEGIRFVKRTGIARIREHEQHLASAFARELGEMRGVKVYFSEESSVHTGVVSVTFDGMDCEEAAGVLDRHGIAVRAGLHCSPLAHRTAGTLSTGTVRFSFSAFNTMRETMLAAQVIREHLIKKFTK